VLPRISDINNPNATEGPKEYTGSASKKLGESGLRTPRWGIKARMWTSPRSPAEYLDGEKARTGIELNRKNIRESLEESEKTNNKGKID